MNPALLVGRQLESAWISHPRIEPHPAWLDASTPLLQSLFVNLVFEGMPMLQIVPAEVDVPGRYPALGIEFEEQTEGPTQGRWYEGTQVPAAVAPEISQYLPSAIIEARVWDALGEGPDSALTLVLADGTALTVRNIYPPMILGIEIQTRNAST